MKNIKKYAIIITFLSILISPNFASAQTMEELQTKIADLLKQLAQLQAQIAKMQDATPEWCHDFNADLKIEMGGNEVEALHIALEREGFNVDSEEKNNNKFDESTASAVSGLQQKYEGEILTPLGLKYPTGYVGKATRAKLNSLYGCAVQPTLSTPTQTPTLTTPVCAQVITPAKNPLTGECVNFATPCEVKAGWQKVDSCPTPTTQPVPTIPITAINPVILISPKGGEWKMGQTYKIYWKQAQDALVTIELRNKQLVEGYVPWYRTTISSIFGKTGENIYNWTIPSKLNPHTGYEICISGLFNMDSASSVFENCSEPSFYISGAGETISALYSVTVVSPNGGETWTTGSAQYIKWSGNVPITHKIITIRLRDTLGVEYNLLTDTINDGLEQIIVPTTLVPGYYTVEIKTIVNNQTVFDKSNGPFSIVTSTTPIPTPTSADITPPIISNFQFAQGETTANSACVKVFWETNEPSISTLIYAPSPLTNQTHFSASAYNNYTTSHNLNGCDLSFNKIYYFKVYSTDAAGNTAESGEQMFTPQIPITSTQTPVPTTLKPGTSPSTVGTSTRKFRPIDPSRCPGTVETSCTLEPANIIKVSVYDEKDVHVDTRENNNSGMAGFLNLPYGNYTVVIDAEGFEYYKASFTVCATCETITNIYLKKILTPSTPPSITVLDPNGGNKYLRSSTYTTTWGSTDINTVYIKLKKGNDIYPGPEGLISDIILNSGSYQWTVPTTLPDGDDYWFGVFDGTYGGPMDYSDAPFSIVTLPASLISPVNQLANVLESARETLNQLLEVLKNIVILN